MSKSDFLKNITFNFDIEKDVPELFVRTTLLQAENLALRQFIITNISSILGKSEEETEEEIESLKDSASKELWAQLVVERGE